MLDPGLSKSTTGASSWVLLILAAFCLLVLHLSLFVVVLHHHLFLFLAFLHLLLLLGHQLHFPHSDALPSTSPLPSPN